ncbi:MAG TPA: ATPase domain-containing protein [Thermoplasmata archaeon]|nr:ATPase domain-containing protein [Thermoplasmata archaeon]
MSDRVSTGVEGLDVMLSGGLLPARPYVVSGPTGSGKTILAAQFLLDGLRRGEPCLLVTLDEPPSEVKANMGIFGWNLDRLKILDATPDIRAHRRTRSVIDVGTALDVRDMEDVQGVRQSSQIHALEVSVHSVQKMIKQEFSHRLEKAKERYRRIVVDSLTALKMFSMQGEDSRILIQSFMRFLSEIEATCLLVSERLNRTTIETEFFLSRGEIRLHKWLDGNVIRRAVSIEKFRGTRFDDHVRPLSIGGTGIVVQPNGQTSFRSGAVSLRVGESFLESRIIAEVSSVLDGVLHQIDEAHRKQIAVKDVEVAVSRAMVHFQRRNYQKALKQALACDSLLRQRLGDSPPPPPPTELPLPPGVAR